MTTVPLSSPSFSDFRLSIISSMADKLTADKLSLSSDDLKSQWSSSTSLIPNETYTHDAHGFSEPTEFQRELKSAIHHKSEPTSDDSAGPRSYQKRIAFDTVDNDQDSGDGLTLRTRHKAYCYNRLSRTILIGVDEKKYSKAALRWLFENLIEDGDELVCLYVVDPSKFITDTNKEYRAKADSFLKWIIEQNVSKKRVAIVLEFSVGKVQDMFKLMIGIYEPAILVVGTRGRSVEGFKGLLPGSVSKYCLQHSPIPVIVVRESDKRQQKKEKRAADPSRRRYREALLSATSPGGSLKYYSEGSTPNRVKPKLPRFLEHPIEGHECSRGRSTSRERLSWLRTGDGYFRPESRDE